MEIVMNTYVNKAGKTINEELMVSPGVIQSFLTDKDNKLVRTNAQGNEFRVAVVSVPWSKQTIISSIPEKLVAKNASAYEVGATFTCGAKELEDGNIIGKVHLAEFDNESLKSDFAKAKAAAKANAPSATVDA